METLEKVMLHTSRPISVKSSSAPIERFLQFVQIHGHRAEDLEKVILNFLQENAISLSDCRAQSYNYASNMAGQYSGLK